MPIIIDGGTVTYYIKISPSSLSFYRSVNEIQVNSVSVQTSQSSLEQESYNYRISFECSTNQYGYDVFEIDGEKEINQIAGSGWNGTVKIKTTDLTNVPNGYYTGYFYVIVARQRSNEPWEIVQSQQINLSLSVALPTLYNFSINKESDAIHYVRQNNSSTKSTLAVVSDTDYVVNGPAYIEVNGEKLPKTFPAGNRQLIFSVSDSNQLEYGLNVASISFQKVNLNLATFVLNVLQTNTNELEIDTSHLSFSHLESEQKSPWQKFVVYTPNPTTISKPNWIELQLESEQNNVKTYQIRSISDSSISVGNYNGQIKFTDASTEANINVDFELYSYWNSNYNKDIHFSLDKESLTFSAYKRDENNYINILLKASIYNNKGKVITIEESLNFYFNNNKTTFDLGQYIHDYFLLYEDQISDLDVTNCCFQKKRMYDFARVDLKITEKNYTTKEDVFWYDIPTQIFMKGHRPKTLTNQNIGFLGNHINKTLRATENGKTVLNYLYHKTDAIKVYINSQLQNLNIPTIQNAKLSIFSLYVDFHTLDCEVGDMVEFQLGNQVVRYQIFPEQNQSNFIAFIDYWGLLKIFEVTGEYTLPISMDYTTYSPAKGRLKNVAATRSNTLTVNTGLITNDDIEIINEILASPKCWFIQGEEITEIIPKTEKLELYDSENELFGYDLEFHINPVSYDKSYRS
ncbi:hypothetical protein [Empedobacter falsenii]|uniref:hypothetical protein n=1 Tax=Empedobacter falsenii TaxID=343874 RepID=UPI001C8D70D7|nr:hypothetical protein [Empedobacter falsenii]MBY0066835.1 hypothetical protein [Empedobacter falsenii]